MVIFVGMFSVSLTVYALNGESLSRKIIGINKHAVNDRLWLELENSIPIEYQSTRSMFNDLDALKLDYILVDQLTAATVYSKQINENNFYVMRKVKRDQSYSVLLNGFSDEQSSCIQTMASLYSKQWLRRNLSSIQPQFRVNDMATYFNLSDELLYPKQNLILIIALAVLCVLIVGGVGWQMFFMNKEIETQTNDREALTPKSFLKKIKGI